MPQSLSKIEIKGKRPGEINNTKVGDRGTFFEFTDNATAGAGNIYDGHSPSNGLGGVISENIAGGVNTSPPEVRYYFDRNSITATGILYEAVLNVWPINETDDSIPSLTAKFSFINDSQTATAIQIGNRVMSALRLPGNPFITETGTVNDFWRDEDGNVVNGNEWIDFKDEGGSDITSVYSHGAGYAFRAKAKNWLYGISGSINIYGKVSLKKFENQPAYNVTNLDVITKDIDFGAPGIKKNIYKVIVTYRAPVDTSYGTVSDSSGVQPRFAINGRMRLSSQYFSRDWKKFSVDTLPSVHGVLSSPNEDNEKPWDARFCRVELTPLNKSDFRNVTSIALRFLTRDGEYNKGFEIDDVSIIYRPKGAR